MKKARFMLTPKTGYGRWYTNKIFGKTIVAWSADGFEATLNPDLFNITKL